MYRNSKKGFTVVELVIVIAIIAILAAVLIPTFAGLIQKANESKDTQLVKNLNTALAVDGNNHPTMQLALKAAAAFGYDVGKINASATGNEILWDSVNDLFCYYNKSESKIQYIPNFEPAAGKTPATYQLWKIYDGKNGNTVPAYENQTYSIYWAGEEAPSVTKVKVGFDAGNCPVLFDLTYENTGSKQDDVVICTNGGTLTVNAKKGATEAECDEVIHYGFANVLNADVGNFCLYAHGTINALHLTAGKVVTENGGMVYVASAAKDTVVERQNGGIIIVPENAQIADGASVDKSEVDERYIMISTVEQLKGIRDNINAGHNYNNVILKLAADLDLSNEQQWKPIGDCHEHAFAGTFDGNNYSLKLAFSGKYNGPETAVSSSDTAGDGFGLFGWTTGNFTVKDLTLDVNFNLTAESSATASYVGGLVGIYDAAAYQKSEKEEPESSVASYLVNISNVHVKGTVNGADKVGGIMGSSYISSYPYSNKTILFSFVNCTNNAAVSGTGSSGRVGGIAGTISGQFKGDGKSNEVKILFDRCNNTGNVTTTSTTYNAGGIAGFMSTNGNYEFNQCTSVAIASGGQLFGCYKAGTTWKAVATTNSAQGIGLETGFGYLDYTPVTFDLWGAYTAGVEQITISWRWVTSGTNKNSNAASYYVGTALADNEWRLTIDGSHYRCHLDSPVNGISDCEPDTVHQVNTVLPEGHWTNKDYALTINGNNYTFEKATPGQ